MENKTRAGGLRLTDFLWRELEKLAEGERRKVNQYIAIVLEDHVKQKTNGKQTAKKKS